MKIVIFWISAVLRSLISALVIPLLRVQRHGSRVTLARPCGPHPIGPCCGEERANVEFGHTFCGGRAAHEVRSDEPSVKTFRRTLTDAGRVKKFHRSRRGRMGGAGRAGHGRGEPEPTQAVAWTAKS